MKRVLITGGAGFIAHHSIGHILKTTDWEIVTLDRLDYSGNLNRLHDLMIPFMPETKRRVKIVHHDLRAELNPLVRSEIGKVDYVLHLAAGSHVDRSIDNPMEFVLDNVVGTCNILNFARTVDDLELFMYFSTDEIFGPAPNGIKYKEDDRYNSTNPYSATKAGGEELAVAFQNTYGLPVYITHTMNVFGERQHPEKFIPMTIKKILLGKKVLIHSDKKKKSPGSRFYIHARNVCASLLFLLKKGKIGEKYHVIGEREVNNFELASLIAKILGKKLNYKMVDFHSTRPGHDLRYALKDTNLKALGWKQPKDFETSLQKTIKWTLKNKKWVNL